MTRFLPFLLLLALVSAPSPLFAQEEGAAEGAVEAAAAEESAEAPAEEPADTPAEEPAAEPAEEPPAADEPEEAPAPEEPADDEPEADSEPAEEAAEDDAEEPAEEASDDEASEEEAEADEDAIDWAGLYERLPDLLAVLHRAAVHMPIALWVLGAVFVLIGVVVPSWRDQIPLACLVGGALCSVPAAVSGWCIGRDYDEDWAFSDITNSERLSESIVQHRWIAVALVISSIVLSIIALINRKKKSVGLGFVWRVGLLALAAVVAWEGHIGGGVSMGDDFFFETAVNEWLGFEYMPTE